LIRARNARRLSAAKKRCEPHCRYEWFGRLRGLGVGGLARTSMWKTRRQTSRVLFTSPQREAGRAFTLSRRAFISSQLLSHVGFTARSAQRTWSIDWPPGDPYLLHALIRHALLTFSMESHLLYASTLAIPFLLSRFPYVMSPGMPMYEVCHRPAFTLTSKTRWQLLRKVSGKAISRTSIYR